MQGEQKLYEGPDVLISTTRAVFGRRTYPVAQISGFWSHTVEPSRRGPVLLAMSGPLVSVALFVFLVVGGDGRTPNIGLGELFCIGAVGLAIMIAACVWYALQRPMFAITLATSGGQVQATSSKDEQHIKDIEIALQQAVVARG